MTLLNQLAANLYPRWWRDRYGDEFAALLEDARPGLAGTLDICKGALAMQATSWSLKRVVAISAIAGVALAAGAALTMQKQYQSVATLRVLPANADPAPTNSPISQQIVSAADQVLSRKTLINVIRQLDLYRNELSRKPQEEIIDQMRSDIQITPVTHGGDPAAYFQLRFTYPDRKLALSTTESIAKAFMDNSTDFELVELSQPAKPITPNRVAIGAAGLAGGLATGGLLAFLMWIG